MGTKTTAWMSVYQQNRRHLVIVFINLPVSIKIERQEIIAILDFRLQKSFSRKAIYQSGLEIATRPLAMESRIFC